MDAAYESLKINFDYLFNTVIIMRKDFSLHNKRKTFTYSLLFGITLGLFNSFSAFTQKNELETRTHLIQQGEGALPMFYFINPLKRVRQ